MAVAGAQPCRATAAWTSLGIWMAWPAATAAVSGRTFAAASDLVVKLLAAAIDQRVSPGCTVCATKAPAEAGRNRAMSARAVALVRRRRKLYPFRRIERGFAVTPAGPCRARAA